MQTPAKFREAHNSKLVRIQFQGSFIFGSLIARYLTPSLPLSTSKDYHILMSLV
jgi:hypothetical protein